MTTAQLRNAIYINNLGSVAEGGFPPDYYRKELYKRTGQIHGYHETEEEAARRMKLTDAQKHALAGGWRVF